MKREFTEEAKAHLIRRHLKIKLTQWDMMSDGDKQSFFNMKLWISANAKVCLSIDW